MVPDLPLDRSTLRRRMRETRFDPRRLGRHNARREIDCLQESTSMKGLQNRLLKFSAMMVQRKYSNW